jgi:hypothetical protein
MTYTSVFGSETIPPSRNGYAAVALTADTTYFWPELASGSNLMADIMEVTPDAAWTMTFPAANGVSTGRDVLIRNLGAFTITLHDIAGGTIGTVAAGVAKYIYITDNSTAAGAWTIFTFGTGTSAADAATLAGYGLVATGSTLSQQYPVVSSAVSSSVTATNRAETLVYTNSGVVTCTLPSAATVGNGFFVNISNQGTGTVTIDGDGAETIDGEVTKDLAPGESCTVVCNAVLWASIGYGRSTQFQFTKLVLDISAGTPFTLTSVQAANKLIQTIGVITGAVVVNVPAVVAVYYIECSHTGAFNTTFKTAAGSGVILAAGDRSILYCDGVDVVQAQTATAPAANLSGGSAGTVVYQSAVGVTSFATVGSSGDIFVSAGTAMPTWSAGSGTGVPCRVNTPTLITPVLGIATATSINKITLTQPATGSTLTIIDGKTLTANKSITLEGTDSTTMTFPTTSATIARTDAAQTFTGTQSFASDIELGHASDTTLARVSAGVMSVEGATVATLSADQAWTGSNRATPTTDNDGSFDMNAAMDFNCTPSAGFTLTFTNITQGQRGCIYLVNGANYAIAAAATTKVTSSFLSAVSATGEYWISYWSPDGTNVLVAHAGDFA